MPPKKNYWLLNKDKYNMTRRLKYEKKKSYIDIINENNLLKNKIEQVEIKKKEIDDELYFKRLDKYNDKMEYFDKIINTLSDYEIEKGMSKLAPTLTPEEKNKLLSKNIIDDKMLFREVYSLYQKRRYLYNIKKYIE